ncbi:protein TIC [Forsythia ovata]|uniref:Protein TIC n=1 Tax=Forsythia ovata TaxID=205694 RepID=A0ABD1WNZ6_9LAMI
METLAPSTSVSVKPDVFGDKRELTGVQSLVDAMSSAYSDCRLGSNHLQLLVATGYRLGSWFGGSRNARIGWRDGSWCCWSWCCLCSGSCDPEVVAANLHNGVVGRWD